jgi:hypothetical protein
VLRQRAPLGSHARKPGLKLRVEVDFHNCQSRGLRRPAVKRFAPRSGVRKKHGEWEDGSWTSCGKSARRSQSANVRHGRPGRGDSRYRGRYRASRHEESGTMYISRFPTPRPNTVRP